MFDKIRDILFDIRDFIIVIAIISVLVFSVTWKIGETLDVDIDSKVVVNIETTAPPTETTPTLPVTTEPTTAATTTTSTTTTTRNTIVRFQVREGEYSQDIANNLFDLGLIESTEAFLIKAHEMGVDTSLMTGVYELRTDDTLETIIKLLSGGSRE